jgi:hypothetical protein
VQLVRSSQTAANPPIATPTKRSAPLRGRSAKLRTPPSISSASARPVLVYASPNARGPATNDSAMVSATAAIRRAAVPGRADSPARVEIAAPSITMPSSEPTAIASCSRGVVAKASGTIGSSAIPTTAKPIAPVRTASRIRGSSLRVSDIIPAPASEPAPQMRWPLRTSTRGIEQDPAWRPVSARRGGS